MLRFSLRNNGRIGSPQNPQEIRIDSPHNLQEISIDSPMIPKELERRSGVLRVAFLLLLSFLSIENNLRFFLPLLFFLGSDIFFQEVTARRTR